MASLTNLSREAVLDAMAQADELGEAAFLKAHGYRASKVYRISHDGKTYPSKAIVGVALGLPASKFFGGVAQTVPALLRIGFAVTRNGRRVVSVGLDELVAEGKLEAYEIPSFPVAPTAVFASGSNRPGEIRGFATVGHDVGVAVPELNAEAIAELKNLAGTDVQVFVDSGAFSEVKFGSFGRKVVAPISHDEWIRRLAIMHELALALGDQVWIVAPDAVGDQKDTIRRLARYGSIVRDIAQTGARILVPMQSGELTYGEFARAADLALGFDRWIPSVPCKKAAAQPADVAELVAARQWSHVHLLGLGPRNSRVAAYLAPFAADDAPSVSLDSCWITGNVGRTNGRANDPAERIGGPRRYTIARDAAHRLLGVASNAARVAELAILLAVVAA